MIDPRNRKKQWGAILGEPTSTAGQEHRHLIGLWVSEDGARPGPPRLLFYTKQEAEAWGNNRAKTHPLELSCQEV